jgi:hypothetical protein
MSRAIEPPATSEMPRATAGSVLLINVLVLIGVAFGVLYGTGSPLLGAGATALVLAVLIAFAAAYHFPAVFLGILFIRPFLDAMKLSSNGSSSIAEPSVAVSMVLLAAGTLWLIAQHSSGQWHRLSPTTKAITGLAIVVTLCTCTSTYIGASLMFVLRLATPVVAAMVTEQLVQSDPRRRRQILVALAASAIIPLLFGFSQIVGHRGNSATAAVNRVRGTFVHPNPFGTYLFIVAFGSLVLLWRYPKLKALALPIIIGCAVTGLFTYARVVWLAFIIGAIVVGALESRRLIYIVLIGLIGVAAFVPSVTTRLADLGKQRVANEGDPNSLSWRIKYWGEILPWTADNYATGIGPGAVAERASIGLPPHNVWVQLTVETGLVGVTSGAVAVGIIARDLRRRRRFAATVRERMSLAPVIALGIGLLVESLSENLIEESIALVYFFVICAATVPTNAIKKMSQRTEPVSSQVSLA